MGYVVTLNSKLLGCCHVFSTSSSITCRFLGLGIFQTAYLLQSFLFYCRVGRIDERMEICDSDIHAYNLLFLFVMCLCRYSGNSRIEVSSSDRGLRCCYFSRLSFSRVFGL